MAEYCPKAKVNCVPYRYRICLIPLIRYKQWKINPTGTNLRIFRSALNDLKAIANTSLSKAYYNYCKALWAKESGRFWLAKHYLKSAISHAQTARVPWIEFNSLRVIAEIQESEGRDAAVMATAIRLCEIAKEQKWQKKCNDIRQKYLSSLMEELKSADLPDSPTRRPRSQTVSGRQQHDIQVHHRSFASLPCRYLIPCC